MKQNEEYKKVWNFFFISQFEDEERWLNDMARKGWNFVRVNCLCRYVFKKGTPGEFIYKLDLPENMPHGLGKEEYYNFLTECGIRIVYEIKEWMYLQKPAADGPFDKQQDAFTKLKMVNKAYGYAVRMISLLLRVFAAIMILCLVAKSLSSNAVLYDIYSGIVTGIGIGAVTALAIIWVPIMNKLRKRMNALVDEVAIKN